MSEKKSGHLAAAMLFAAVVLEPFANAHAQAGAGSPKACSVGPSEHGVTMQSCAFTLAPSPGGNAGYFVNVTLAYTAPAATAVRFRCLLGNGSTSVAQYGVLRKSGTALTFVSPFVASGGQVKTVACYVDAT